MADQTHIGGTYHDLHKTGKTETGTGDLGICERLKESDAFDLVWSDKVGYVLLDISPHYNYVDTARRIDTAAELCRLMLEDVALDVLLLTENEHSIETADPLERAEIVRRWQLYFEQLPEYEYLREELTSAWP